MLQWAAAAGVQHLGGLLHHLVLGYLYESLLGVPQHARMDLNQQIFFFS